MPASLQHHAATSVVVESRETHSQLMGFGQGGQSQAKGVSGMTAGRRRPRREDPRQARPRVRRGVDRSCHELALWLSFQLGVPVPLAANIAAAPR